MGRSNRWLIFVPVAIFALLAQPAKADVLGDWTYSQSRDCGGSVEVIDNTITLHGPDNGTQQFGMCGGQANWVKIEATIPADVNTVDFTWAYQTNDGWVYDPPQYGINGVYTLITQQNNVSGTKSVPVQEGDIFTFRQYSVDTCCQPGNLTISNLSLWEFTATTSTTVPDTTTTIQETTTSWESTTTSTTTTTTTSTIAPSTTVAVTPNLTTTTLQTIATIPVEPTMPEPPATVPLPQIEPPAIPETIPEPPDTLPDVLKPLFPPIPDTMPEPPNTTVQPPQTLPFVEPPDTVPLPPDTVPDAPQAPETSEPAKDAELPPISDKAVVEALAQIDQATPEEVKAIVTELLTHALTTDQAVSVASEPAVLAVLTNEEAAQVFEQVAVKELTTEQATELVAAVQDAPTKVRKAFEAVLNLFQGFADDYVMTNQTVPIKTRRALIALGAVFLVSAPASTRRNKR